VRTTGTMPISVIWDRISFGVIALKLSPILSCHLAILNQAEISDRV
jgi:hypothetical protein